MIKKAIRFVYHQNIGINDITLYNAKLYYLEVLQHIQSLQWEEIYKNM